MVKINTNLPSIEKLTKLPSLTRVITFSQPFNLEEILEHTKGFIEEIFGEPFAYRQSDKGYCPEGFSQAYIFDNGKDWIDQNAPGGPKCRDGAGLVLYIDGNGKKCSLRFSYIRLGPLEHIAEWSKENPFDMGYETYGSGYNLIPFEVYASTFTNGILALKNFYQSIIDTPLKWPGNVKRRGAIWGVEDKLKRKLEPIVGTKGIIQIDDVARIGSSGAIEIEWWLLQETHSAYATGLQGAKYERRHNHDQALKRAIEFSGMANADNIINSYLDNLNQIGQIERLAL